MSTASARLPEGRYGRSSDQRADRMLKIIGAVLGVVMLGLLGWFGYHYVVKNEISGEVISFDAGVEVISFDAGENSVRVHLEVHKNAGTDGYCTVRSVDATRADSPLTAAPILIT